MGGRTEQALNAEYRGSRRLPGRRGISTKPVCYKKRKNLNENATAGSESKGGRQKMRVINPTGGRKLGFFRA